MIQLLATRYSKHIAYCFFLLFLLSAAPSAFSRTRNANYGFRGQSERLGKRLPLETAGHSYVPEDRSNTARYGEVRIGSADVRAGAEAEGFIGGPGQPEMSSFKSVGTDNMVNLFTGDFSYNIPLLDVGGYPVNIFYDGGVTMEQEASWVGLGWNINPGNISRNMRGIPDDFNGEDTLVQTQNMKPNITWGVGLGSDFEVVGTKILKVSVGVNLGVSWNNYLGPALDLGFKGTAGLKIATKTFSEKAPTLGAGLGASISSRNGLTISPNVSLMANSVANVKALSTGIGISTSYNSKAGVKALQIAEQTSFDYSQARYKKGYSEAERKGSISQSLLSTSISFSRPSYLPALRMPITNEAYSGHFQLGGAFLGAFASVEAEVYRQESSISKSDTTQRKPMIGYLHYQKAKSNPAAVMDFTRLGDNEVTPTTPIISAPQYTYDVFSIQGEGTGGSIRAYRNDQGYVRDNLTRSQDKSLSIGADVGIPGHYGANFNTIKTPSLIGEWTAGNQLKTVLGFTEAHDTVENVYFRNPGETSVLHPEQFKRLGGTELVRFKLGGSNANPTIEPILEQFSKEKALTGTTNMVTVPDLKDRKKRTQVTSFLTAEEASKVGLDPFIKSYKDSTPLNAANNLQFDTIKRVGGYRKKHHISQINVTEAGGRRYIYGIPVYDTIQKDLSFSVIANIDTNATTNLVNLSKADEANTRSELLDRKSTKDGFVQITQTPAYAHSFLLTGLLSPDYVDVTGNGITEDDLGDAVKFNYTQVKKGATWQYHTWRTPLTTGSTLTANANIGNRTNAKDDKGLISYGVRESWYAHSIESKTMIALFTLEDRKDGKGAASELSGVATGSTAQKRLKKIDLYSKADLKKNGLTAAKPIKTVWFAYSYKLCAGTPDNNGASEKINGIEVNGSGKRGKLTLDSIYFTFNGKNRVNKNKYVFSYGTASADNPGYVRDASDRWGNYKVVGNNPQSLKNSEYPYTIQTKATADLNASAWSLKKVLLPSGGQLEVEYESDDYAFVQNRKAALMLNVLGLGKDSTAFTNKFYSYSGNTIKEHDYVFVKVPVAVANRTEAYQKYVQGISQLSFKMAVNMPKGMEFVTSYGTIEAEGWGKFGNRPTCDTIWIKLNRADQNLSPLTLTALDYLREQLPAQAFVGYDVSESGGLKQIGEMLGGWLDGLKSAFKDPIKYLRSENKAQMFVAAKSFVRLNDPDGFKYGGGQRVKRVRLKDNWKAMTGQYTSEYGQEYDYTTTEVSNGVERLISSGVVSYEPSVGGEENPFQSIVEVANKLPMGPAAYGAVELPVLDAFFPAPLVGYSKVTVRSLKKLPIDLTKKSRSGIGKQVTEFYTAKDFPVYYSHTNLDASSDKSAQQASLLAFFSKSAFDSRALSQGFLVETNDMHGKMKSQSSYGDNDTTTRLNYTENFYRNTGSKGLGEKFDFVYGDKGGLIEQGNMGIDIELMTDTREFSVKSSSLEIQGQLDLMWPLPTIWVPFIWPVTGTSENVYRAVTTTKVINYHGVLDSIVVIDKGSQVSTKNLVYDAETGSVVVNRTNNEFKQPIYTTTYPAYWAYSGMGLAYKNIDAIYSDVSFLDGKITGGNVPNAALESGDEILIIKQGTAPSDDCGQRLALGNGLKILWVLNKNKNITPLTDRTPDFVFIDSAGKLFTRNLVSFRVIRSGKRNMLSSQLESVVSVASPSVIVTGGVKKLVISSNSNVVNASAIDYKEKWQVDLDVIKKKSYSTITTLPDGYCKVISETETDDCLGEWERSINPYLKGLLGNFRVYRNFTFFGNRVETNPTQATNISKNGFLSGFKLFWDFNTSNNLIPDLLNKSWVWNSQLSRINRRGQELETKNALGVYTAALYGFDKSLPVAITENSKHSEMVYEGFEDYVYKSALNLSSSWDCSSYNQLDFVDPFNSQVIKAEDLSFNAHSGKYVLKVNANSTLTKSFNLKSSDVDSFNLKLKPVSVNYGPWVASIPGSQVFRFWGNAFKDSTYVLGTTNTWMNDHYPYPYYQSHWTFPYGANTGDSNVTQILRFYYTAPYSGVYNITSGIAENSGSYKLYIRSEENSGTPKFNTPNLESNSSFQSDYIYEEAWENPNDDKPSGFNKLYCDMYATRRNKTSGFAMCAGKVYEFIVKYKMAKAMFRITFGNSNSTGDYQNYCTESAYAPPQKFMNAGISSGLPGSIYTTKYQFGNVCYFNKPIAGSDSLVNPKFAIPSNKKMLFSVWVKESCSTTPCTKTSYTDNKVVFTFNEGSSTPVELKPSGTIIEGWQRYEGNFTAPATATQMTMSLVNSSSAPVYFDDVRIHPYNANMKSYVYDPISLRLVAELDANNYATFYEYDEEGTLIRTKAETKEGIKTINETRSFKQQTLKDLQ